MTSSAVQCVRAGRATSEGDQRWRAYRMGCSILLVTVASMFKIVAIIVPAACSPAELHGAASFSTAISFFAASVFFLCSASSALQSDERAHRRRRAEARGCEAVRAKIAAAGEAAALLHHAGRAFARL